MSAPARRTPGSGRRRQSERSEVTRSRVIAASVAHIAERGLPETNLARIAERAGVTTGAIQHQFGDKESVLIAVVEHAFDALVGAVSRLPTAASPAERLQRFVEALWRQYLGEESRAALEILIQSRARPGFRRRADPYLARIRGAIDRMWMGLFWDLPVSRDRHVAAQRLLFTTLNGLAVEKILVGLERDPGADLERLVEELARLVA